MAPWLDELNEAFLAYIRCGGFPLAVTSLLKEGEVSREAKDAFLSSFLSDLAKLRRSEGLAKRVLKAVIEKLPSPMSLNAVATEFEIGSHKTVFYFLELFEKMFVAKSLHFLDPAKLLEVYRKERKVHLTDPLLYAVFSEWCMTRLPPEPALVESVAATHLARKYRVGYWRDGTEIDVVLPEAGLGLEIKWGERAEVRKKKVGKIRETVTLTKNEFREPLAVPLSSFLASLRL
jgi:predicted AAA+ superfamily ATPase